MLKILFCFCFFFLSVEAAFATQFDFEIKGERKDITTSMGEEDVLKYNAFKNALVKELTEKKLDSKLFFEKIEVKKMTVKEEYDYYKSLFSNVGLAQPVSLPEGKEKEQVVESPELTGYFKAELDSEKLQRLYDELTSALADSAKKTFYIIADIDLDKISWEDVGVSKKENFASVIVDSWKKLISTQFSGFDNVIVLEKDFAQRPEYMNEQSLTLKWKSLIKKTADHPETKTASFEVYSQYVLLQSKSSEVLAAFDFPIQKREVDVANKKNTSSTLASLVYNLFLSQREKVKGIVESSALKPAGTSGIEVKVISKIGLSDVLAINSFLQEKFKDISLISSMKSFSPEGTVLKISAQVSGDKMLEQLATLDGKIPLNEKKILLFDRTAKTFAILPKDSNN